MDLCGSGSGVDLCNIWISRSAVDLDVDLDLVWGEQNRDLGRGKKNCIHETMIPEWMDLVVWGHEHECQVGGLGSVGVSGRIAYE